MKVREGLKLKGHPAEIPECSRNDLPEFFKEKGFKVGVEVGVYKGQYTEVLAKSGLTIFGVDPWLYYRGYPYQSAQDEWDKLFQHTKDKLSPYKNVTLIRKTSMEAVKSFEEESLDFVYIDGNHRFQYVAEDIMEWGLRVKVGGVICGHDYAYFNHRTPKGGCQVREIVDSYAKSFDVRHFWVLGGKKDPVRDRFRSWMIIKQKYEDYGGV